MGRCIRIIIIINNIVVVTVLVWGMGYGAWVIITITGAVVSYCSHSPKHGTTAPADVGLVRQGKV